MKPLSSFCPPRALAPCLTALLVAPTALAMPVLAPNYDWQGGEYPDLVPTESCMDFADEHAWVEAEPVFDEASLRKAVAGTTGPTRIPIGGDITLTETLALEADTWLYGLDGRPALSAASGPTWQTIEVTNPAAPPARSNIRLTGLQLSNIRFVAQSTSESTSTRPEGISLVDVWFFSEKPDNRSGNTNASNLVKLARAGSQFMAEPIDICDNLFVADWDANEVADSQAMIGIWRSTGVNVVNNAMLGRMRTGINVNGSKNDNAWTSDSCTLSAVGKGCAIDWTPDQHSQSISIDNNIIQRQPTDSPTGPDGEIYEDHGIYMWGAEKAAITGNSIRGWTNSAYGGCVKLASSAGVEVSANACASGMLLYTHVYSYTGDADGVWPSACDASETWPHYSAPPLFQDISVSGNSVCQLWDPGEDWQGGCIGGCGISYSRYQISSGMPWPTNLQGEYDVSIADNDLGGGSLQLRTTGAVGCSSTPHPNEGGYDATAFSITDNIDMQTYGTCQACSWEDEVDASGNEPIDGSACL